MAELIKYITVIYNFMDICPSKIVPTWDIGRTSDGYVEKRLDRFFLHEQIVERLAPVQSGIMNNLFPTIYPLLSNGGEGISDMGCHSNLIACGWRTRILIL